MQLVDMQLKHNDCGVSVIKTICNIHNVPLPRSYIEQQLFLDNQGSRLSDIKDFFTSHGFEATPQLLDLHQKETAYYASKTPFILPTERKGRVHYVVVNGYRKGRFSILDPLEATPYSLTIAELRKRVHVSHNVLRNFSAHDQSLAVCQQLLQEYGFDVDAVCREIPADHLFNKVSYFAYIRDEFGFKTTAAERDFLHDIIHNQDIAQLPRQFELLQVYKDTVAVQAPIILPVKKNNSDIPAITAKTTDARSEWMLLFDALGDHRKSIALFVAIALISVSFTQLYVFINQYFLDEILTLKNTSVIGLFVLGLISYKLFDLGLYLWKKWLAIRVALRLDRLFLASFDDKLNRYSLAFIQGFKKGDLTERLSDATKLKAFFTKYLVNILVDTAVSLYIIGVLLYLNWQLTCIVLAVMALFYGWFRFITPYLQKNEQIRFTRKSDFFSSMLEKMEGIQTLKSLRYDHIFSRKIAGNIENLLDIQARSQQLNILNTGVTSLITLTATVSLIWLLSYESAARGALTIGEVVTFLTLSSRVFSSLGGLLDENLTVQENMIILKRYFNFCEQQHEQQPFTPFSQPLESMELDDVSFGYHPAEPILKHLSLTIRKGDRIRIQGKNGSGKSTLSKVIALLYPAQSGTIRINNVPLTTLCADAIKEKVLLVSTDDALFNDTLLYNLTFQNVHWDTRIDALAEKLGLASWITSLHKQGTAYRISESGRNLSTGQRKKILILRALLHPAECIIFDEVLSGLDTASRIQIEQYFNEQTDKTCIFISHEHIQHINFTATYTISKGRLTQRASQHEKDEAYIPACHH